MANEENEIRAVTMDLNLYLGLPRSSYPRSLDLGSDLSLSSLPVPASSDSNENRSLEATSVTMDASSSHPPYSPSYAFMAEADVLPLANSWPMAAENPISPYFHAYEPQGYTCAQESEAPSILYSPSNARDSQFDGLFAEPTERHGEEYRASFERVALDLVDTNLVRRAGFQTPYSPPYHPTSIAFQEEENFGTFPSFPSQMGSELFSRAGGSSSQHDLLHSPEFQIRRSIESHGWREMPFRQSLLPGTERTTIDRHSSLSPSQLMLEIMRSQRTIHANGNRNDLTEVLTAEISEKESGEKSKYATNFECNICFDVAKEPIVTSCGHLFCWPCLYQWLYVHSDHKECPVCKGEVPEANLTPIYGRGRSASTVDDKDEKNRVSDLPIPPRPCGNRLESWRQHFYPISRRIGEGIANSWRRFLNYQIHSRNRFTGHDDTLMQEIFNGETPASLTRYMTRRLQREHGITENGSSNAERIQRGDESIPIEGVQNDIDGVQGFHYLPSNDCLVSMNSDIGRTAGRYAQRNNLYGPSSSNVPPFGQYSSIPIFGAGMAVDQASASSTVAVISGGSSARDVSVGPNSAGSSWRYRRTERNSTSVSSEEDGNLHSRKRRRLP